MTAGNVLSLLNFELENLYDCKYIVLHNPELDYLIDQSIGSQSIFIIEKPFENWGGLSKKKSYTFISSFIGETIAIFDCLRISNRIKTIINNIKPPMIFFVIESQTSVRVAKNIMKDFECGKIGIYWDPIDWWLAERKINVFHKLLLLKQNKTIIKNFDHLIAPSNGMSNYFLNLGNKNISIVYPYYI